MQTQSNARPAPLRLHHAARIVRDHEATRKLLEDGLGIPLVATWCENVDHPEAPGTRLELCHCFYRLRDGSCLAFFQFGNKADLEKYEPKLGSLTGLFDHTALKVDAAGYAELVERAKACGIKFFEIDHGFCQSLYVPSDQGFTLEFTLDPDTVAEIDRAKEKTAHEDLRNWLAGDHRSNNDSGKHEIRG